MGETVRLTSYNPAFPALEFAVKDFKFVHPVFSIVRQLLAKNKGRPYHNVH
jgi:hypothetical protein